MQSLGMLKITSSRFLLITLSAVFLFTLPTPARADYSQRLELGAGVLIQNNPSQAIFELGAEYEKRMNAMIGLGGFARYLFSTPGMTDIGVPEVFLHPFTTEFFVSAAPMIQFGSGTDVGVHFGTRLPIPLGIVSLIPTAALELIAGQTNLILGLGIAF